MVSLPVITGFGGFSAAGRSSCHHAYRRMVIESLPELERQETLAGLAVLMKLVQADGDEYVDPEGERYNRAALLEKFSEQILDGTLIRRIESRFFDVDAMIWQKSVTLENAEAAVFETTQRQLPEPLPRSWRVEDLPDGRVRVEIMGQSEFKVDSYRNCAVKSAGQLPAGFEPSDHYNARFHPRALQMAVVGASDAINSLGVDWDKVVDSVEPDQVGVYSGNVMSQLDQDGLGGMLQSRLKGGRVSTKQCPLGLNSMPADFVNAYVIGSVGHTGATIGACATFLYNLRAAVEDIKAGKIRVAVVGNAEAPITPEIIDGYATMGALASEEKLAKLDGLNYSSLNASNNAKEIVNPRLSSRPFGENCGFTIAESSQYIVLMDDALALELGADIHAAVSDVFVNADGYKKSISAPGAGNYITMAKAVAAAVAVAGETAVREHSFIQAHGSSTPQNRVTESKIFDVVAKTFQINNWPVTAVKSYLGHSIASASADQLMSTLGVFKYGFIPGIKTIDKVAEDVHDARLQLSSTDIDATESLPQVAFLNSKGFGGNNATAAIMSSAVVEPMLKKRYGEAAFTDYLLRREETRDRVEAYDLAANMGDLKTRYRFGENMIDETKLEMTRSALKIPGFAQAIDLQMTNPYKDMI